ncbi:PQ loop repeat-domain-containing protein [Syncephalis pseudoplumigaleata]|uniref:PQ loop repeat-domain-containing protein n=1 Tax=Syncephalis pseudoplumigaleata TaxID=1712513 RepID=A0A4P9YVZ1_9FUNG|nr:PQ loop repeat-domain-containing protein [Syncephalis pseudoplumigaleata]|eukprot:RKP23411.1 PQ loop repeat-domain-containing protein [Syncephalis pseudoplumigaleata]
MATDTATSLQAVSYTLGWLYFLAWSASFYPQIILNWRRKSVQGLSQDFVYLNTLGFLSYAVYNAALYFDPVVREQYRRRHHGEDSLVQLNDVVFGLHALVFIFITLAQTFIYKGDANAKRPLLAYTLVPLMLTGVVVIGGLTAAGVLEVLDLCYYFSYVKLVCTFSKYCPQLYLNFKRKSTVGWSIWNILLDITGGILSIVQELLDAHISGHWAGITGNVAKFALGFITIGFDTAFIVQHYVLYRDRTDYYHMDDGHPSSGHRQVKGTIIETTKAH